MRFIILTFLIIVLTLPSRSFAALDYGKQSLVGADFSGSDLKGKGATFYLTDLQDANLSGCELQNATLYGAKLKDTTLDSAVLDGTDLSNTNLEDSFAYSTQFENVKIQGADFTNVFLPKDILRKFCESASGTNPFTNRDTRDTLECDYI